MVLEWTLSKRLGLAYSKIDLSLLQRQSASQENHGPDFSLLQRQSASQENHGSMGDSSISLLGILGAARGQDSLVPRPSSTPYPNIK